jgi:hypothetical protein
MSEIRDKAKAEAERQADKDAMEAAEGLKAPEDVKQSYREATERGANQKGEGRIP